jgi:hypothetical protein
VGFKGWRFRFTTSGKVERDGPKIPALAKAARMGHRAGKNRLHCRANGAVDRCARFKPVSEKTVSEDLALQSKIRPKI